MLGSHTGNLHLSTTSLTMAKRKRVLIDSEVQWAIGRRLMLHWLLFLACLLSINTFLLAVVSLGEQGLGAAIKMGLKAQLPLVSVMLVLLPVFVYDTMKLSNRFAGPMYRLRISIAELARGKPTRPVRFRDGDFWLRAANEFNELRDRVESLEARNQTLEQELKARQEPADLARV